jgi:rfaE bifunctional protein nucleotidyltransferase chain/domain
MAEIILDHHQLKQRLDQLKIQNKKIVFTNGCFDLLHVGHVRYLQAAKALGDILVLALNSDDSVRRLKGTQRPLLLLQDRIGILSAFRMVDFLTAFEENTVENLLLKLQPDIHAKGTDYTVDNVPEHQIVKSFGGAIAIVGDPKNHATKNLIQEILEKYGSKSN